MPPNAEAPPPTRRGRISAGSVLAAEAIPHVQLDAPAGALARARAGEAREHGVERPPPCDPRQEGFLAANARRDLQRLAPVPAAAGEHAREPVGVRARPADR